MVPPGVNALSASNSGGEELGISESSAPVENHQAVTDKETGPRPGGYVDTKTARYIPPPEGSAYDSKTETYIPSSKAGSFDQSSGEYYHPHYDLTDDGEWVAKEDGRSPANLDNPPPPPELELEKEDTEQLSQDDSFIDESIVDDYDPEEDIEENLDNSTTETTTKTSFDLTIQ